MMTSCGCWWWHTVFDVGVITVFPFYVYRLRAGVEPRMCLSAPVLEPRGEGSLANYSFLQSVYGTLKSFSSAGRAQRNSARSILQARCMMPRVLPRCWFFSNGQTWVVAHTRWTWGVESLQIFFSNTVNKSISIPRALGEANHSVNEDGQSSLNMASVEHQEYIQKKVNPILESLVTAVLLGIFLKKFEHFQKMLTHFNVLEPLCKS